MKLIGKYLKPFFLAVIAIILLTYAQVQTELALPDYMSNIVTGGIQYGGIEEDVPSLISEEDFKQLLLFVDKKDIELVNSAYQKVEKGTVGTYQNESYEFEVNTYLLTKESTELSNTLKLPMVYNYLVKTNDLKINESNFDSIKNDLDKELPGLVDNYGSMAKLYIQSAYNDVGINIAKIQSNYILNNGIKMLGISLISVLASIGSTYFAAKVAAKVAAKLRSDVFRKVGSFSNAEFSTFSTASLITRSGNDITKVQNLIQILLKMVLFAPMMGITAILKVTKYPQVSWILLVAIGIIIAFMIFLIIVAVPKFEKIQKLVDKINNIMREFLDGMLVIRAFNAQKMEENKFDDANKEQTSIDRFISRCLAIIQPVMTVVMNCLTIIIVWVAAGQIDIDAMSIGDMMAFVQYAMHVVISFMFVSALFFMIPRSLVSVKRIEEVLNTDLTILDKENTLTLPEENGVLEFDSVSFKYPGAEEEILKDISFKANPGETVAIIGSTGSGKSTIVKLLPRLFDVTSGSIKYCGIDLRDVKQTALRDKIGFASQKAILFTGDIRSNIAFGRDVSQEELAEAIDVSQSKEFIDEREKGVDDPITQGGTNVSGGQKQRISIARTLAKKKNIYIFDDTFSALDYETDKKLRARLQEVIDRTKATVFIVAQRISTIKNADKILVVDGGQIVGEGKHEDLLKTCKVYLEIAKSQLSEEELNYGTSK